MNRRKLLKVSIFLRALVFVRWQQIWHNNTFSAGCPQGSVFSPASQQCTEPKEVPGCENYYEEQYTPDMEIHCDLKLYLDFMFLWFNIHARLSSYRFQYFRVKRFPPLCNWFSRTFSISYIGLPMGNYSRFLDRDLSPFSSLATELTLLLCHSDQKKVAADDHVWVPGFRIRIRCFCMDPDPVFKFSGSGSGFQIFWIQTWIRFQPRFWKIAERSLKVIYQKKT